MAQVRIDTKGYTIKGLRKACADIDAAVRIKELYFIYFNIKDRTVSVNTHKGGYTDNLLILESGVYKLSQQDIANLIIDRLEKL